MPVIQHTVETSASPATVWALWTRVEGWPLWQDGLQQAGLEGALRPGTWGRLRLTAGRRRFRLLVVEEGRRLRWEVRGFLRRAAVEYRLEPTEMGCRITHSIEITGWGAWMDPWFRAGRLGRALPEGVRRLARLAAGGAP